MKVVLGLVLPQAQWNRRSSHQNKVLCVSIRTKLYILFIIVHKSSFLAKREQKVSYVLYGRAYSLSTVSVTVDALPMVHGDTWLGINK